MALIEQADIERLARIRLRVFAAIADQLAEDSHCKSYEGAISISIPNYFEHLEGDKSWGVHLGCYVLGPSRGYDWHGDSLTECMDKMEATLDSWNVPPPDSRHLPRPAREGL